MNKKWFTKIFFIFLVLIAVFVWTEVVRSPGNNGKNCQLYFLNVGQGDSELIQKGDYQILIDGGPDDKVLSEIGKIMPLTDRKIDVIILTHPHADHLSGLNQILDRYEIGKIYATGVLFTSNGYLEFLDKVKNKNIQMEVPDLIEKVIPFENAEMTFLWPGKEFVQKNAEDNNLNNTSEVVKFCYFNHCALFTGDIQIDEQAKMIDHYCQTNDNIVSFRAESRNLVKDPSTSVGMAEKAVGSSNCSDILQSDLLKISHHGSTNGTDQRLIDIVQPKTAVIEVGADNKFGHPHAATIDLLQKMNIQYYRTDKDGTVEFNLSAEGMTKSSFHSIIPRLCKLHSSIIPVNSSSFELI